MESDTPDAGDSYEQALEGAVASIAGVTGGVEAGTDGNVAPPYVVTQPRRSTAGKARPGPSVTKRLLPVGIGALVLLVVWRVLRSRTRPAPDPGS